MNLPRLDEAGLNRLAEMIGIEVRAEEVGDFVELAEFIRSNLADVDGAFDLDNLSSGSAWEPDAVRGDEHSDPFNAVVTWCDVRGSSGGLLGGKRVGVKDNIAVAGVPTTSAFGRLKHIPDSNAVIVDRLLGAGATIVAKLNMDAFAWSGGADTSSFGNIRHPTNPAWSAGGSSGGSAAALYLPEIDITIGTDQGGSIRVPASWCGVLGMKPSFGLVPYAGIMGMDPAIDHVGPLARTVIDLSAALTVLAGFHADDQRQNPQTQGEDYSIGIDQVPSNLDGLTFGALSEGFALQDDDPPGTAETIQATRKSLGNLQSLGASVQTVSVPEHSSAPAYLFVMLMESLASSFQSPTGGYGHKGSQDWRLDLARVRALRSAGTELPATVRIAAIMGAQLRDQYAGAAYSLTRARSNELTVALDRALAEVDFIVMPAATHYAHPFQETASISEQVKRGWDMFGNTISTNISGHPAISLPMARVGQWPVGVMFVGPKGGDRNLLELASIIERNIGWFPNG